MCHLACVFPYVCSFVAYGKPYGTSDESDKHPLPIHRSAYVFAVSPKLCLPKAGRRESFGRDDAGGNFEGWTVIMSLLLSDIC